MSGRKIILSIIVFGIFFTLISINLVSSQFGFDDSNLPKVTRESPTVITFNNNTGAVNTSNFWDGLDTFNTTQMEDNGGVLNILESWLESLIEGSFNSTAWQRSGTNVFLANIGDSVGIGTISPGRIFEVFGSASVFRFRDSGATASSTTAFIEFGGTDAGVWNRTGWIGDGSSGSLDLSLRAEVGDLLLADSSGIALTLSEGDATFTGNVGIGNNLTLLFGDLVSEQNPDAVDAIRIKASSSDVDVVLGDPTGYFSVWNSVDDTAVFFVNNVGDTDLLGDLNIGDDIFMSEDGIIGISASTERILFDGTGGYINLLGANIGIGTSTPQNALNVIGDGNFTGNLIIGTSASPKNITMFSPDGTSFSCGVANDGTWGCI